MSQQKPANAGPLPSCAVSRGLFGICDDFGEKYQSLDERFIKNKEATFFFIAHGASMEPTIFPNDTLVVDRSLTQYHNRVCILAFQGELICKRVMISPHGQGHSNQERPRLKSDNPRFKDIILNHPDDITIWGVVIARISETR